MSYTPGVVSNPAILGGKPTIKGKRVPVALVLGQLASGATEASLLRDYGLTPDQIRAALGYAAQIVSDEELYVAHP